MNADSDRAMLETVRCDSPFTRDGRGVTCLDETSKDGTWDTFGYNAGTDEVIKSVDQQLITIDYRKEGIDNRHNSNFAILFEDKLLSCIQDHLDWSGFRVSSHVVFLDNRLLFLGFGS